MKQIKIEFIELPIENAVFSVYYVLENGKSNVMDNFNRLPQDTQDSVIALIKRLAKHENYKSPKVKLLKGYSYWELRPVPHRFFYFRKCGYNYIFFEYVEKKANKLKNSVYQEIENKKEIYEQEFERYIQRNP